MAVTEPPFDVAELWFTPDNHCKMCRCSSSPRNFSRSIRFTLTIIYYCLFTDPRKRPSHQCIPPLPPPSPFLIPKSHPPLNTFCLNCVFLFFSYLIIEGERGFIIFGQKNCLWHAEAVGGQKRLVLMVGVIGIIKNNEPPHPPFFFLPLPFCVFVPALWMWFSGPDGAE